MSKSLSGSVDLTLNSLNLVEVSGTNITASQKLKGNELEITTNATITGNLALGSLTDVEQSINDKADDFQSGTGLTFDNNTTPRTLNFNGNIGSTNITTSGNITTTGNLTGTTIFYGDDPNDLFNVEDEIDSLSVSKQNNFSAGVGLTFQSIGPYTLNFTGGDLGSVDLTTTGEIQGDTLKYLETGSTYKNVKTEIDSINTTLSGKQNIINSSNRLNANLIGTGIINNTQFNYLQNVSSNIQTQLDGKQNIINSSNRLNANLIGTGIINNTEFNYLDGVTSSIQTQLDGKEPAITTTNRLDPELIASGFVNVGEFNRLNGLTQDIQPALTNLQNNKQDNITAGNNLSFSGDTLNLNNSINLTGDVFLEDNGRLVMGDSDDLIIEHQTSQSSNISLIRDRGAGSIGIRSNGGGIFLQHANADGTGVQNIIVCRCGNQDKKAELFFNGSKKLETENGGIRVFGSISLHDSNKLLLGSDDDCEFYHDGNNMLFINKTGDTYFRNRGSNVMTFQLTTGNIGILILSVPTSGPGYVRLGVVPNGTTNNLQALITSLDGNNQPQITVPQIAFDGNSRIKYEEQEYLQWYGQASDDRHSWRFNSNGNVARLDFRKLNGDNNCDIRAKSYSNISDDRMKSNETPIENATDTLLKLKPMTYDEYGNMQKSDEPRVNAGLIAQKIYYDAPELRPMVHLNENVNGTIIPDELPDDVTSDSLTDEDYINYNWGENPVGVNYNYLIPYLIKSVQELSERIKILENNI